MRVVGRGWRMCGIDRRREQRHLMGQI